MHVALSGVCARCWKRQIYWIFFSSLCNPSFSSYLHIGEGDGDAVSVLLRFHGGLSFTSSRSSSGRNEPARLKINKMADEGERKTDESQPASRPGEKKYMQQKEVIIKAIKSVLKNVSKKWGGVAYEQVLGWDLQKHIKELGPQSHCLSMGFGH